MGFVPLCLAYFTERDILKVRPCSLVQISFLWLLEYSVVWIDHIVLIHSPVHGYLDCLLLAVVMLLSKHAVKKKKKIRKPKILTFWVAYVCFPWVRGSGDLTGLLSEPCRPGQMMSAFVVSLTGGG